MSQRPPLPPFTLETARQKVLAAEAAWNTRDPDRVVLAYTEEDVPWWRIVRADGSLAKGARQRALLEAEGVPFRGERVDMRAARIP